MPGGNIFISEPYCFDFLSYPGEVLESQDHHDYDSIVPALRSSYQ